MKNGNLIVKLEDGAGVDDQDVAKSINQVPCHLVSFLLAHSKRSMKNVIREKKICTVITFTTEIQIALALIKNNGQCWLTKVTLGNFLDLERTTIVMQVYFVLGFWLRK